MGEMREGGIRDHPLLGEEMVTTSVGRVEGKTTTVIVTGTRREGETTTGIIEEVVDEGRNRMIVDRGIREEEGGAHSQI